MHLQSANTTTSDFKKHFRFYITPGYSLLETLIAFVVLVVFVVLGYSLVFRNPNHPGRKAFETVEDSKLPKDQAPPASPSEKKVADAPQTPPATTR
jgi:hypothetical protein